MREGVRIEYYKLGEVPLEYDICKLLNEIYPDITCYIIDAKEVDRLIHSFFKEEDLSLTWFLKNKYPRNRSGLSLTQMEKLNCYYKANAKNVWAKLKQHLMQTETRIKIFDDKNIPDSFIARKMPEIYRYISEDINKFKRNINLYQMNILKNLLICHKMQKSLTVFIYKYLIRTYRYKCIINSEVEREINVYAEGEKLLEKNGIENILDLLKSHEVSEKIQRYLFDEYSEYIIAMLSDSEVLLRKIISCYPDDDVLESIVKKKETSNIFNKKLEELNLSSRSNNMLSRSGYHYIADLPKTEKELQSISNIGHSSAIEILEKLKIWYKDNNIEFIDEKNKDMPIEHANFSERVYNAFYRAGYRRIADIPAYESDLLCIRNIGKSSIKEIRNKLKEFNIIVG